MQAQETPPQRGPWRLNRPTLVSFALFGIYSAVVIWLWRGDDAIPREPIHEIVLVSLLLAALTSLMQSWVVQARSGRGHLDARLDQIEALIIESNLHHARALAHLQARVTEALEQRGDIPTDKIVAVVNRATADMRGELAHLHDAMDTRFAVVETALEAYGMPSAGRPAEVVQLPSNETREAIRNLSQKLGGDIRGDTRGGRNYRE